MNPLTTAELDLIRAESKRGTTALYSEELVVTTIRRLLASHDALVDDIRELRAALDETQRMQADLRALAARLTDSGATDGE